MKVNTPPLIVLLQLPHTCLACSRSLAGDRALDESDTGEQSGLATWEDADMRVNKGDDGDRAFDWLGIVGHVLQGEAKKRKFK